MKKEELDQATQFLDQMISLEIPQDLDAPPVDFQQKLDRLSELIDMVRFHHGFVGEDDTPGLFTPNTLKQLALPAHIVCRKRLWFALAFRRQRVHFDVGQQSGAPFP